jgi:integrase
MMTAKQFISRLAELRLIPLPGNIRSRRFRFNHSAPSKIETFTVEEVHTLLKTCEGFSDRTKLYLLLMLNCGMYQNDIAELQQDEVNWKAGTLTRARSKTRERHGPVVTYKLWPALLAGRRRYAPL